MNHINEFGKGKMGEFETLLSKFMTRAQIKYTVTKLVEQGMLDKKGEGRGTEYFAGEKMKEGQKIFQRAVELGFEEMKKRGELPNV